MAVKNTIRLLSLMLSCCVLLCSCFSADNGTPSGYTSDVPSGESVDYAGRESEEIVPQTNPDISDDIDVRGEFSLTDINGAAVQGEDGVYRITSAGDYTAKGLLENGRIIVEAGEEDDIKLVLDGVSVMNSEFPPILCLSAAEMSVNSADGSVNLIEDKREAIDSEDEESFNAAIYSLCDLKITGRGTLIVTSEAGNGIKTKDDLRIKNVALKVTASENALKGNDSVTVYSGSLTLISENADGIKTSNSDVSAKGKQKGSVTISGGSVDIYSARDGIDAAYNVEISENESCKVNIFTASYAQDGGGELSGTELYLVVPADIYSENDAYYAYFYNEDDGVYKRFEYETMVYGGRNATYYGLKAVVPTGYGNVVFRIADPGAAPDGENYSAATNGGSVNSSMNAYLITEVNGESITGDWVQLSTEGGNSNKTAYSSKGIKAANSVNISGGTLNVRSMDDGIHANSSDTLENGSAGAGEINVTGGTVVINAADDGMHADGELSISGGSVNITKAHEGLEGNVINISGGEIFVYGEDDGLNACRGSVSPLINVTGGYLDVTTPSGDTDAIDSNGSFTMSGGFALVKGGASQGSMMGSVDVDGSITVTGGAIVALGGICETPSSGSVNTYVSSGTGFAAGSYELVDESGSKLLSFSLNESYTSVWISSDDLELKKSYALLKDGEELLSWTQSSSTEGSSGNMRGGGFGGGMPGGRGGRGGP